MAFCGNVVELVEKFKIIEEKSDFIQWREIVGDPQVEVYIETGIISEFTDMDLILIDVAVGQINGEKIGMLFIKKQNDVYG
jgi:hypothetical protein